MCVERLTGRAYDEHISCFSEGIRGGEGRRHWFIRLMRGRMAKRAGGERQVFKFWGKRMGGLYVLDSRGWSISG
jgi:hypothetical protein